MTESAKLQSWVQTMYLWIMHAAPPAAHDPSIVTARSLQHSRDQLMAVWHEFTPAELKKLVDVLLGTMCGLFTGTAFRWTDLTYHSLIQRICSTPPHEPVAYSTLVQWLRPHLRDLTDDSLYAAAFAYVGAVATSIDRVYNRDEIWSEHAHGYDLERVWSVRVHQWAADLVSARGITVDKVRRLGFEGTLQVVQALHRIEGLVRGRGASALGPPAPEQTLPSAEVLLGTVGVHTETAAQRFTTLDTLLRDLVVLCASRALAGSTSGHESAATSPLGDLTLTVDRLTGVASWRLFKDFLPDAQEGAVDQVREKMFKTCGKIRAGQAIDVRRLAAELGNLLTAHVPGLASGTTHDPTYPLQPPLQPTYTLPHDHAQDPLYGNHSLGHAPARPQISEYYARRHYGTTVRAWEARVA